MQIDAHQHFWYFDARRDAWITNEMSAIRRDFLPHDLLPELQANEIDATVAVQADPSERETEFLLALAAKHPFIAGVVGWIDLCSPLAPERLAHFSKFEKLRGFRHVVQSEPDDRFMLRPDFLHGIKALAQFNFTYDVLIYPRQLPAATALIEKFPNQSFVIDHMAKPEIKSHSIKSWAAQMRAIARNTNVYCKISGLVTEADWHNWRPSDFRPYFDVAFESFGTDRVMFGSDWPVCLVAAPYRTVKQLVADYVASHSASDKEKLFGANAAKFYGIKGKP